MAVAGEGGGGWPGGAMLVVDGTTDGWLGGVSPMLGGRIGGCDCIFAALPGGAVAESLLIGGRNMAFLAVENWVAVI